MILLQDKQQTKINLLIEDRSKDGEGDIGPVC